MEVIRDAATAITMSGEEFDCLMLFQPTNPIRSRDHIIDAIQVMSTREFDKVTCHYIDHNINLGYLNIYEGKHPEVSPLIRSGNFYIYSNKSLYDNTLAFKYNIIVPKKYGYNINVEEDFGIVESLMKEVDDG
jgi:CMP-N-acetylneuraminic acid synthetase